MNCTKPIIITKNLDKRKFPDGLKIPCGQCLNCRIQKRKEWQMRVLHESEYYDESLFVTLTYKEMPKNKSLDKEELKKFFKRLRKRVYPKKFKYFACGEYGEPSHEYIKFGRIYRSEGNRPHYHFIVLGLGHYDINDIIQSWSFADWNNKRILKNSFGSVSPDSIGYVCGYIHKKFNGEKEEEEYLKKGLTPVFKVQSLGIGKQWCIDNAEQIKKDKFIRMFGIKKGIPRQYLKWLDLDTEEFKQNAILEDCKKVKDLTGQYMQEIDYYKTSKAHEYRRYDKAVTKINNQKDLNLHKKIDLKKKSY